MSLYFQEDNYETDIEVDGCPLKVELIDTAGNVSKLKERLTCHNGQENAEEYDRSSL